MRPGSSSGGMGAPRGAPPGTSRLTTGAGGRPPATARLQSGLTSSMGRQAAVGIALQQGVNITDRPTTMQGMKGMRATTAGPGRLVQDSTYFVGILRGKVNAITEELERLKKEKDSHTKESAQASSMQRKAEELDSEVRKLEGTLADYNIAMDKMRQGTDPDDLNRFVREYDSKNKAFGNEIDRIFLQVKQEEQGVHGVESQIEAAYANNQAKINAMDPNKLRRYQELVQNSMQLQERYQQQVSQVDAVGDQIAMLQQQRDANSSNQDYRHLEQQALKLHKQMQGLVEELEICKLEPEEMQKRMLAKVRADNAQAQAADEKVRQVKEELARTESAAQELKAELDERAAGGHSEKDKYEKLYARDREMSEFIEQFEGTKNDLGNETASTQERIVALLAHIASGLEAETSMPDQAKAKALSEEASFKAKQLESSQQTYARLMAEKNQRAAEVEKIASLDTKMQLELSTLGNKMAAMRQEMVALEDLEGLRSRATSTHQWLQEQVKSYRDRASGSRQEVGGLRRRYEDVKAELSENETYRVMEANEARLRKYAQTIFQLSEYVETKGRETDYESLKENCLGTVGSLNSIAKETLLVQAQNLSDAPLSMPGGSGY